MGRGGPIDPDGSSQGRRSPSRGIDYNGRPNRSAPYGYTKSGDAARGPRDNQPINTSGYTPFYVQPDASGWSTTGITSYTDKVLMCKDCGRSFTWTYQEQIKYAQRGHTEPKRCPECRANRRAGG